MGKVESIRIDPPPARLPGGGRVTIARIDDYLVTSHEVSLQWAVMLDGRRVGLIYTHSDGYGGFGVQVVGIEEAHTSWRLACYRAAALALSIDKSRSG